MAWAIVAGAILEATHAAMAVTLKMKTLHTWFAARSAKMAMMTVAATHAGYGSKIS